jgi:signal peptidase I
MLGMDAPVHLGFVQLRPVQRGDIIIFRPPYPGEEDKDYIKRCIAVAGDDFRIANNAVYINGQKLDEPYVQGVTKYTFPGSKIEGVVPEGMVIALGDNRENSSDSRVWGYLAVDRIKAKALVLYWNGEQMNPLVCGWSGLDFSRIGLIR